MEIAAVGEGIVFEDVQHLLERARCACCSTLG
jgi:hypothetical protein